jgi:dienelactone hydrolase
MTRFILLLIGSITYANLAFAQWDISKSWENAQVQVPGSFFTKSVVNVSTDKPLPTVILMHGCTGIHQQDITLARDLTSQGFIVVMPDSLAIPKRVINCNVKTNTPHLRLVPVENIRPEEIKYAVKQLQQLSWADKNNIFLIGHSEGAMGASIVREAGLSGIIISGFTCFFGIHAYPDTPVLAINFEKDPWLSKISNRQCKDAWGDRTNAQQIILPGAGHDTYNLPFVKQEIVSFLKTHIK